MHQTYKTIFLVDDDPDDQLLFSEALYEADATVLCRTATDGIDALVKLNSDFTVMPDFVFMDVNMPRMNGIDCLKEMQQNPVLKDIPVIMYSTSCSPAYQKECFNNGAVYYMEKPNDFAQLCNALKSIVTQGIPQVKTTCNHTL
ncbi:hypothetical protein Q765_11580 [Flavobacterium rivuli WB 3.3-2 = DSM 21788]|uniref:Response regulatory domain-containing protein n=1 Tax=Flavobacterium rivuli WB 3.3-2 = DSM 21788 TaxID=1121895 RepID=A0A0A2M3R1_9FLAO|nr:response regulator [Flavobacterium rivuli]KGO86216.1 hypothetical protein Q765_11580 [Flavobacterium rivuli WB 3.3-2 = DSM 21788]